VLGVAIGAAVIAISHPDRIWASLQQADLMLVLVALALNVPVIWLRALRALTRPR